MYGISILHTNRQPYQHLIRMAKVPLEDLPKIELVYGAIGFNKYSLFDVHIYSAPMPFIKAIHKKGTVGIYFDMYVSAEDSLFLFVQYDHELHLSAYSRKAKKWTELACYDIEFNGIFNAIQLCGIVYIIDNEGVTYILDGDKLVKQEVKEFRNRKDNLLVIDKDSQTLSYIAKSNLQEKNGQELKKLIEENRVKLPHEN